MHPSHRSTKDRIADDFVVSATEDHPPGVGPSRAPHNPVSRTKTVGALFVGVLAWTIVWTVGFDLLITLFD